MALDVKDVVGADNMAPDSKDAAIAAIRALDLPAINRRFLYAQWARRVGLVALPADLDRVAPYSPAGEGA